MGQGLNFLPVIVTDLVDIQSFLFLYIIYYNLDIDRVPNYDDITFFEALVTNFTFPSRGDTFIYYIHKIVGQCRTLQRVISCGWVTSNNPMSH